MRRLLLVALIGVVLVAPARASEVQVGNLSVVEHLAFEAQPIVSPDIAVSDYSNVATFLGQAFANGGAALQGTNNITRLVADDITPTGTYAGLSVIQVKFSVANFNAATVTVRPRIRFWFADGPAGAPGTYYNLPAAVGFSFNPLAIAPGVTILTGALPANSFSMPGVPFWAGVTFDDNNGTTGITVAQLNNMGQGLFDPPTIGSSNDGFFVTTAAGSFFPTANPAGSMASFSGNPVGNFGWEFTVDTPVPANESTWGRVKSQYRN